jgi:hypothetical protein
MMVNRRFVVGKQRSSSKEGFFDGDRFWGGGRKKERGRLFFPSPGEKEKGRVGFFFQCWGDAWPARSLMPAGKKWC